MTRTRALTGWSILLFLVGSAAMAYRLFQPGTAAPVPVRSGVQPTGPGDSGDYVGSSTCAECHAGIAASYQGHPMARSMTPAADHVSAVPENGASFRAGPLVYEVGCQGDGIAHSEALIDAGTGEVVCRAGVKVQYVLGSGTRGQSFLVRRGDLLFQSPISWYAKEGRWDLSPGYRKSHQSRFERRVGDDCLSCHAGRVRPAGHDRPDAYGEPPFAEMSIGCERCHGPGRKHVQFHRSGELLSAAESSIVNPARLEPELRDDICFQCHLTGRRVPREGRGFHDFRPGEPLEDFWVVFVAEQAQSDDQLRAVSHVEQMRSSTCFLRSDGRLSCTSCHDPHQVPSPEERVEFYRSRCLTCHQSQGCSQLLSERSRPPASNSCTFCHMPSRNVADVAHTAQTDHRILRRPGRLVAESAGPLLAGLTCFNGSDQRMPSWEAARAWAVALFFEGYERADSAALRRAERFLREAISVRPNDAVALDYLGRVYYFLRDDRRARDYFEASLKSSPNNEEVLSMLGILCYRGGDYSAGLEYLGRSLELNPWRAELHARRAEMFAAFGNIDAAITSAERALKTSPTLLALRKSLVEFYRLAKQTDAAQREQLLIERITDLLNGRRTSEHAR